VDVSTRKECYEAIFSFCSFLANESFLPDLLVDDLSASRSGDSSSTSNGNNGIDAAKFRYNNSCMEFLLIN